MNNSPFQNQFQALVQNEMTRLQGLVAQNERKSTYPVAISRYAPQRQSAILRRHKSTYHTSFLSLIKNLRFMSFFF